jgi:regulator of replication initiation timing
MQTLTITELEKFEKEQLIEIILMLIQQNVALHIEVAELKERLNQNSTNSSKPPSSDGYAKPAPKSMRQKTGKKPGGQQGHKGHGLKIIHAIKETVELHPERCPGCGHDLQDEKESFLYMTLEKEQAFYEAHRTELRSKYLIL